ncbi:MAG: peptidase M3A and M3B thimet/oligopeptidase F [Candidatus Aegiribacteria sp.]|nr:peptidase M3A and M3B thimet/oligopeptidase F [Candidatus Aegiribacteria sp.]MBD3294330.1 peptidase M3A and M3B thimet/oligopeptidase F [Candidatus Fermentibacteria bacterium]
MKRLYEIAGSLKKLQIESSRLNWVKYTTGYDFGILENQRKIQDLLQDEENWKVIQDLLQRDLSRLDLRRVEIMEKLLRPYHLSPELNRLSLKIREKVNDLASVLNTHRLRIGNRQVTAAQVSRILSSESDRNLRREAYLSRTQVNEPLVKEGFLDLIAMRKDFADKYGASDFVEYQLQQQELDPAIFDSWSENMAEILPLMKEITSKLGEKYIGDSQVMPWDYSYISSSIAPELNRRVNMVNYSEPIGRLFQKFGFDLGRMNITYDIFPRKNKSEWGYNFPVEEGVDSRILANVSDRFYEFRVLLHETGHAVHSFSLNPDEVILNMGISGIISEGIANLFGGLRSHRSFFGGFLDEGADADFRLLGLWSRILKLRSVVRILFDQDLYRKEPDSGEDIAEMVWATRRRILEEEPYASEPVWAVTIHHTTHPIYLHNYLLGDLTCDMLKSVFQKRESVEDFMEEPKLFGDFLREEVISPSGRYPFPLHFKRISGEEVSLTFLTEQLRVAACEAEVSFGN